MIFVDILSQQGLLRALIIANNIVDLSLPSVITLTELGTTLDILVNGCEKIVFIVYDLNAVSWEQDERQLLYQLTWKKKEVVAYAYKIDSSNEKEKSIIWNKLIINVPFYTSSPIMSP